MNFSTLDITHGMYEPTILCYSAFLFWGSGMHVHLITKKLIAKGLQGTAVIAFLCLIPAASRRRLESTQH